MFKPHKSMVSLTLALFSIGITPVGYTADFFTIIGPDGRPLVIPRGPVEIKEKSVRPSVSSSDQDIIQTEVEKPQQESQAVKENDAKLQPSSSRPQVLPKPSDEGVAKKRTVVAVPVKTGPATEVQSAAQQKSSSQTQVLASTNADSSKIQSPKTPAKPKPVVMQQTSSTAQNVEYVTELNGEKYIDSEYLEEKEFNLEGKKRFYMMPEGIVDSRLGAVRMQPEEREKGVSKSFLQSLLKKNQNTQDEEVLALSPTYYRMPKEQVVESLQTACFTGKKLKDAKLFNVEKQIGLWPRKPLKDTFDYDVVKLSASLKQLKLTSYAATEQNPTFYWPFVVFLDQKGCILEGVSGYKNQEFPATMLQHAAIEGTIRLPDQTAYILLTPLASALDVQEKSLSNQGQIKLTAIR